MYKRYFIIITAIFFTAITSNQIKAEDLFLQAKKYESTGKLEEAKNIYTSLIAKNNNDQKILDSIESLNIKMLLAGYPRTALTSYTIKSGDNLNSIANTYNVPYEFIMELNNIKSAASLQIGQKISIPGYTSLLKIKIDTKKNILILYKDKEKIKQYPVAVGKSDSPTPKGIFTIENRIPNPTWTLDGKNIPGGDPKNGLGSRWMGFKERTQYGIHGTNQPESIGKSVSSGCIRMHNHDVEELYKIIPKGTKVEIN